MQQDLEKLLLIRVLIGWLVYLSILFPTLIFALVHLRIEHLLIVLLSRPISNATIWLVRLIQGVPPYEFSSNVRVQGRAADRRSVPCNDGLGLTLAITIHLGFSLAYSTRYQVSSFGLVHTSQWRRQSTHRTQARKIFRHPVSYLR